MNHHVFIGEIPLAPGFIHPKHAAYLKKWRERTIQDAEAGIVAASSCLQATFIDLVLFGKPNHDWLGIMDEHLSDEEYPIAYSLNYSRQLHKYDAQYKQTTIHAIHARWWLESITRAKPDHAKFVKLILAKQQSDGLFYDRDVSETILRHRMKLELTYSMAMAVEIIQAAGLLTKKLAIELATEITNAKKCPCLGYMSMENLRFKALKLLGHEAMFPVGIENHIESCAVGLAVGWCDFSMKSKVDAYMGTAKRTQRDKPIHTPLIANHVATLISLVNQEERREAFGKRLLDYCCHLKANPLDIPAFQMRDVPIAFGADITPLEIISASFLLNKCQS